MALAKMLDFYNFPESARDQQIRITDFMARYMNEERAMDVIRNDLLNRTLRAFKYHSPTYRPTLVKFVEAVLDAGFEQIEIARLVSLVVFDMTAV